MMRLLKLEGILYVVRERERKRERERERERNFQRNTL